MIEQKQSAGHAPASETPRLIELATKAARYNHYEIANGSFRNAQHIADFETCPHPDCVLVRSTPASETGQASAWQPIIECPREVTRAILLYPAFKLDDDGNLTAEPAGEPLVTVGYRNVNGGWEEIDPTLEATGQFFGDEWEYGNPTHFQLLPLPLAPSEDETTMTERINER